MPTPSLRILHASDLHLELPLHGVRDVPVHLRETFLDAAYRAAEGAFSTAIEEGVDLVLLCGDVLDARRAGPRAVVFLREQFERLAAHSIEVYWATGGVDPVDTGSLFRRLPDVVHVFPAEHAAAFVHRRNGEPVAWIAGQSQSQGATVRFRELARDVADLYSIGVLYQPALPKAFEKYDVDYLALGGLHAHETHRTAQRMAHHPGTIQGRTPRETGPHGCSLVEVSGERTARTRPIHSDVVRWIEDRVEWSPDNDAHRLESMLHERMRGHLENAGGRDVLVCWRIATVDARLREFDEDPFAAKLLAGLRDTFGLSSPTGWSLSITGEPPENLPASWYEQETILGDFLRLVHEYQTDDERNIGLESYLPETLGRRLAASGVHATLLESRQQLLRDIARLGVERVGSAASAIGRRTEESS
jgi:hypothetical protein